MNIHNPKSEKKSTKIRKWLKRWEIVANWISKVSTIAIPVVIAYFVWQQNEISLHNQSLSSDREYELKLVEIAWHTYLAGDSLSISKALNLIETLEPKAATKLALIISQDTTQTNKNRKIAKNIVIVNKTLRDYIIKINYIENDKKIKDIITTITKKMRFKGINISEINKQNSSFFEKEQNTIKYSNNDDRIIATSLAEYFDVSLDFEYVLDDSISNNTLSVSICETRRVTGWSNAEHITGQARVPGMIQYNEISKNAIVITFDNNDNGYKVEYAIYAIEEGKDLGYLKPDGIIGDSAPKWQKYSEWGTVTVKNLKPDTSYTFKIKARNEEKVETEFSEISQIMKTLQ